MPLVEVINLKKYFGKIRAVDGISFTIEEGEIFGLIGPNGAGKSTTLRILATILKPTEGTARIWHYDVVKDADKVRKIISYLPEEAGAYANLSGREYLEFMARFWVVDKEQLRKVVEEGIRIAGLGDRINDKTKTYSKGMKRRLLLARALMFQPKFAILDEPTSGLDVVHSLHVRKIIKDYAKNNGVTILVSSHNMLEVDFLCDRVALINKGKILDIGTPKELKEKYDAENLEEVFVKVMKNERRN